MKTKPKAKSKAKKQPAKKAKSAPAQLVSPPSVLPDNFPGAWQDLETAIRHRRYDEVERIGNELLDLSPSEEADRCLNDIIGSANTIRDAEDEIRYQLNDLKTALERCDGVEEVEVDGL